MVVYTSVSYTDKKRARRKKIKRYFLLVCVMLILAGSVYLLFFTDIFRFKEVRTSSDDLSALSEISWFPDYPYFWQSPRIENPHLASVSFQRNFLSKVLTLVVTEREKYGVWCGESASSTNAVQVANCFWFDKNGVLFREAPMVEGTLIPKIRDFTGRNLTIGNTIFEGRFTSDVLRIFELFQRAQIALIDLRVDDLASQELTADLLQKVPVYFSLRFDPSFALPALLDLKSKLTQLSYIDFRSQNKVFYK